MQYPKTTINLILILLAAVRVHCWCSEPVSWDLSVTHCGKYVWRGIPQTTGSALQPSLTLAHGSGLSASIWINHDVDSKDTTEKNYMLSYAWSQPNGTELSLSCVRYVFLGSAVADTTELAASSKFGSRPEFEILAYYDVDKADGLYVSAGIYQQLKVFGALFGKELQPELSARVGLASANHNAYWFGVDKATLNDLCVALSWPVYANRATTVTLSTTLSTIVSSSLRAALRGQELDPTNFYVSLNVTVGM
ncbi:MAG: hypothetical protein QHI38_00950 [Armatimonadota bacterium]|nr:hypothetical protein [Armatimonadota bacterium]